MPNVAAIPDTDVLCLREGRTHACIARAVAALDLGIRFDQIDGTIPADPATLALDERLGLPGLECVKDQSATAYLAMVGLMALRELERLEGGLYGSDAEEALVAPAIPEGGPVVECLAWVKNNKTRIDEIQDSTLGGVVATWEEFVLHVAMTGPACHPSIAAQKPLFSR
jgi:hypothetical protein